MSACPRCGEQEDPASISDYLSSDEVTLGGRTFNQALYLCPVCDLKFEELYEVST